MCVCVFFFSAITCTGRECYWRNNAPGKNPGFIHETQYASKKDIRRRVSFDPTPTAHRLTQPISSEELAILKTWLVADRPTCLLLHQLGDITPADDVDKGVSMLLSETRVKCSKLLWEFNKIRLTHHSPFEVPDTRGQRTAAGWISERAKRCTASNASTILSLTSDRAHVNFLRKTVWGLDRFQSEAMQYGQRMESIARDAYLNEMQAIDPTYTMHEVGLFVNPKYPTLGCSPNGILQHPLNTSLLAEIKVVTNQAVDPRTFDTDLTGSKLRAFYLRRDPDNHALFLLKPNHAYRYQIQMSLDILEMEWCHLVVWSDRGHVVVPVRRDPAFWNEKRFRLIKFHREVILPELTLQRTKRHLPPIRITYPEFHEDENDPYFSEK